jgi:signal transduction histidine kinase
VSIRLRLALVFTVAAAVVFSLGAWLFVSVLSASLLRNLDASLEVQVDQATQYLPASAVDSSALSAAPQRGLPPGEYAVQVIDPRGLVRGTSQDAPRTPIVNAAVMARARTSELALSGTVDGEASRVVAGPLADRRGWVAIAAVSLSSLDATRRDVLRQLLVAGPVFVLLAGVGAWVTARAALSPVERLRRQAVELSQRGGEATLEVPRTRDELAALAVTMNALLSRLQRSLARQRRFVADAGHELRTPLAVLRAELELASREGRSGAELKESIADAAAETDRLAKLTNDLLLLARSDSDQLALHLRPTSLRALLERSAERAGRRAGEAAITLSVQTDGSVPVLVDADRLEQAIDNLVGNALRYAPRGSTVVLYGGVTGHDAVVEVLDSGAGFPPDFVSQAFERFSRPDEDRSGGDGSSGLGLAIVQAIVEAHGGRAVAANRPSGGAAVRLQLPGAAFSALVEGPAPGDSTAVGQV